MLAMLLSLTLAPEPIALCTASDAWSADEGCAREPDIDLPLLTWNPHYLAPPAEGVDYEAWLAQARQWRRLVREERSERISLNFDGVRAWVRADNARALRADIAPGERIALVGEARPLEGSRKLCLAFDLRERSGGPNGRWSGWSTVLAHTELNGSDWAPFRLEADAPTFDAATTWARPILGMDGTFDPTRGSIQLRNLRLELPATPAREDLSREVATPEGTDPWALYNRADLAWAARNWVCGFLFLYEEAWYDREAGRYRVEEIVDEAEREFGGWDSIVLWHDYPRIGCDERNQFDFWRDMPGGLEGLRDAVRRFHARGVQVFLPYMPWDQGTRRSGRSDTEEIAAVVGALEADGVFLDTMIEAPRGLREAVDAVRPGVVFEPEGHPSSPELSICSSSWAQGLLEFPGIGVLRHRWLEPRHMQHQIRRWDTSHQGELEAAWLNGSGMLVWENVFGSWNPWSREDRATLRRMTPVLRACGGLLLQGEWRPCEPTGVDGLLSSSWQRAGVTLRLLVNRSGGPLLLPGTGAGRRFDLWRGLELLGSAPQVVERLGATLTVEGDLPAWLPALLERQSREAARSADDGADAHAASHSIIEALPPPPLPEAGRAPAEALPIEGGRFDFRLSHLRRECGCYPDPGTASEDERGFLWGLPWDGTIEHRIAADVAPCRISPRPVTRGEYARYLTDLGDTERAGELLTEAPDDPMTGIDLDEARAYATWAGGRLPTEWEWQHAAESLGGAFARGEVWEWTESERSDGHTRSVWLRGGSRWQAQGSGWYFPGGAQPIETHARFLLLAPSLDRCSTVGFRCVWAR